MTILIIFGFWLPEITAWLWLSSTIGAFLIYFLVFENLYQSYWSLKLKTHEKVCFLRNLTVI